MCVTFKITDPLLKIAKPPCLQCNRIVVHDGPDLSLNFASACLLQRRAQRAQAREFLGIGVHTIELAAQFGGFGGSVIGASPRLLQRMFEFSDAAFADAGEARFSLGARPISVWILISAALACRETTEISDKALALAALRKPGGRCAVRGVHPSGDAH